VSVEDLAEAIKRFPRHTVAGRTGNARPDSRRVPGGYWEGQAPARFDPRIVRVATAHNYT
jgi:hypothetical protein